MRAADDSDAAAQSRLARTANPEASDEAKVSQPSDVLTARAAAAGAFDSHFLGLGVVSVFVGAVGVANIMIISVLERRSEIGLRRALGATKGQIRTNSSVSGSCSPSAAASSASWPEPRQRLRPARRAGPS